MTRSIGTFKCASAVALLALTVPLATLEAQASVRSGQQVVEAVCAACHATGANGAPRIGDESAWQARAAQEIGRAHV